jgi:hypothetical protein
MPPPVVLEVMPPMPPPVELEVEDDDEVVEPTVDVVEAFDADDAVDDCELPPSPGPHPDAQSEPSGNAITKSGIQRRVDGISISLMATR